MAASKAQQKADWWDQKMAVQRAGCSVQRWVLQRES